MPYKAHVELSKMSSEADFPSETRPIFILGIMPRCGTNYLHDLLVDTISIREPDVRYGAWLAMFTEEAKVELFSAAVRPSLDEFDCYQPYRLHYNRFPSWETLNRICTPISRYCCRMPTCLQSYAPNVEAEVYQSSSIL